MSIMMFFFFFQAEDGIRDVAVTGVQTCALPILTNVAGAYSNAQPVWRHVSKAPAELTLWLAQTTANGMVPWFHWLCGSPPDKRLREVGRSLFSLLGATQKNFRYRRSIADLSRPY